MRPAPALSLIVFALASCGDQRAAEPRRSQAAETSTDYAGKHLVVYDLRARYEDSLTDGRVPGVTFKLKNSGGRTLNMVKVRVTFKDAAGRPIDEKEYTPVLYATGPAASFGSGDNRPLRPGYVWQMEPGKFFVAKTVPSEWKEGAASAEITQMEFADNQSGSGR